VAHGGDYCRFGLATQANILAALEEHGNRMTFPRRELAALLARWTGSFTAEEIIARMPTLGRASIYRTLRLLVDIGILCKTKLPDGSPLYSLDGMRHHHHLVCVSCGRIDEFHNPSVERMLRAMANQFGEIVGHRLDLYHRCQGCIECEREIGSTHMHGACPPRN